MNRISKQIVDCFKRGNKILICGNGGLSTMANHMAGELVCTFEHKRRGLPAISLTSNEAVLTAWGNDVDFEDVFRRQVEAFGKPGDILVALSTSGKSKNVLRAIEEAHRMGLEVVEFPMAGRSTAAVQTNQLVFMHLVCREVEKEFI
jgi:phosphoheptose isomerase